MQKNSEQTMFWYDTYEPLSADVMSSDLAGIKCAMIHLLVFFYLNIQALKVLILAGRLATK
jgi:hypothetical protein